MEWEESLYLDSGKQSGRVSLIYIDISEHEIRGCQVRSKNHLIICNSVNMFNLLWWLLIPSTVGV